jgi:cytochrome c2
MTRIAFGGRVDPAVRAGVAAALLVVATLACAGTDPLPGRELFTQQCATCHSLVKGEDRVGPSLYGVVGRKAGSLAGFDYSPALKASRMTWDAAALDLWLTDSDTAVPGSYMGYKQADAVKRGLIIGYLSSTPEH